MNKIFQWGIFYLFFIINFPPSTSRCGCDFPYCPPELCSSRGENIQADGVGVDLWAIGIMILRLFTKNHSKIEDISGESPPEWSEHVYRKLFDEVSIYFFSSLTII